MSFRRIKEVLLHLYNQFDKDEVPALGAQISYYLILSFFPFLIFLIVLIGYIPLTEERTLYELALILPHDAYSLVEEIILEITTADNTTLISFGMLGTLWTASRGTSAMIRGMNKAYNVKEDRPFWKVAGMGVIFTIGLAFMILFSLTLLVFGQLLGEMLINQLNLSTLLEPTWRLVRYGVALLALFSTFTLLYLFGPNYHLKLKNIYWGALFSTVGWVVISLGFAYYVNNFGNYTRVYGSIGGVMILLIWLYLSSLIVLMGAEVNSTIWVFSKRGK
ncbi:putative ribonuclease BN [Alkaliphilus metalliredigens QYMF]|uniref:Putative ribonuclease BN n=1 Tax=Alkaliphilus metalliredigens (strain QYMF) TaxID=293826 RepID=A6TVX2_ALKMQ|nr:YihY/virulence factor BrkB family protein [Alkaliphilus metalliredigens]ABR50340.1 putative ribonuclease BN [Alkaliphilus metalliredigens QYMF]